MEVESDGGASVTIGMIFDGAGSVEGVGGDPVTLIPGSGSFLGLRTEGPFWAFGRLVVSR